MTAGEPIAGPLSKRCAACLMPPGSCLCDRIPRIPLRLQIDVIRHVREEDKLSNSVRVAALALPGLRVHRYGVEGPRFDAQALLGEGTALLYPPEEGALVADPAMVRRLVVPDGTWAQSRRMVRRVPGLLELPRLHLPELPPARSRLRRPTTPEGMSTLEALAAAVALLESEAAAEELLELYALLVRQVWYLRGRGGHGVSPGSGL